MNNGGLDSLILKIISENQANIKVKRIGINDKHIFDLGNRNHLHMLNNLDDESIIKLIEQCCN
jgi:transketolase C-terminal domain/subunit